MQRDCKIEKTGIEKVKSDNTDKGLAILIIDLGASRNERFYVADTAVIRFRQGYSTVNRPPLQNQSLTGRTR
jgi:hypothetical protein